MHNNTLIFTPENTSKLQSPQFHKKFHFCCIFSVCSRKEKEQKVMTQEDDSSHFEECK